MMVSCEKTPAALGGPLSPLHSSVSSIEAVINNVKFLVGPDQEAVREFNTAHRVIRAIPHPPVAPLGQPGDFLGDPAAILRDWGISVQNRVVLIA